MKKIDLRTESKRMLADVYTPVSIYLRLRDRFRDTILLESTDAHVAENSYSFICIGAIGGIAASSLGADAYSTMYATAAATMASVGPVYLVMQKMAERLRPSKPIEVGFNGISNERFMSNYHSLFIRGDKLAQSTYDDDMVEVAMIAFFL